MMLHRPVIILSEMNTGNHSRGGEATYSQYVCHLEKRSSAVKSVQSGGGKFFFFW
jgi:protein arginine N-methyltransferase 5